MNCFRREDDAAETAALAVDMFGRRIDHAIGAERERRLKKRRREHVVDYERRAGFMRDIGNRRDVDDLERRIGRRLQKEGLGVRPHRVAPLVEIGAVDQGRGNSKPRQIIFDDVAARAEQRLCADHVIAAPELAGERERHRRHAGRGRARGLGAFERRHALLEHRDGRVGETRILKTRLFVLEAPLGLFRIFVNVALGEEQRFGRLAILRAQRAGMHQTGFGTVTVLL